ncbi:MAG: (2Fe-2S)-binding protein [Fibrobacterales bacterium]
MAQLIKEGKTQEVEDGAKIQQAAEELGVSFGCQNGVCGACEIEVVSGSENLEEPTEAEEDYGVSGSTRLACQCLIKSGSAEIS